MWDLVIASCHIVQHALEGFYVVEKYVKLKFLPIKAGGEMDSVLGLGLKIVLDFSLLAFVC